MPVSTGTCMAHPHFLVDDDLCYGCGACVALCPTNALSMKGLLAIVEQSQCTYCELCIPSCPVDALMIEQRWEFEGTNRWCGTGRFWVCIFCHPRFSWSVRGRSFHRIWLTERLAKRPVWPRINTSYLFNRSTIWRNGFGFPPWVDYERHEYRTCEARNPILTSNPSGIVIQGFWRLL